MGKSYRAIAKEKYEAFEAEWLKTHDKDVVCTDYFLDVNLKVNELPKSRNGTGCPRNPLRSPMNSLKTAGWPGCPLN